MLFLGDISVLGLSFEEWIVLFFLFDSNIFNAIGEKVGTFLLFWCLSGCNNEFLPKYFFIWLSGNYSNLTLFFLLLI